MGMNLPSDLRALATLTERAARSAASVIRTAEPKRAELDWREKGPADFVTEVDVMAERAATGVIQSAEPGAVIVAEESHASTHTLALPARGLAFIIDPLDGTTNFLHGLPEYAVSIAAVVDGALTVGIVFNVPRDQVFFAVAGHGAWLGDARLAVSSITNPDRALIGTGFPFKTPEQIPEYLPQMARVMRSTSGIRRPGAASIDLAHVAAGRLDGFWENFLSPWDVAAGILLIREAGGVCTDSEGRASEANFGSIVAGNPPIHEWLLRTLKS